MKVADKLSPHLPIILIPGVAGSKMNAVNKKTGESTRVWANTDLIPFSSANYAAQYLWGEVLDDGVFHSFCEDFVDIEVIDGLAGCDQILDLEVFGIDVFNKLKMGIYFSETVKFLETLGYVEGADLRCFTYDWREVPYLFSIQERLRALIDELHTTYGKVHLIGHSLGGLVIDHFIKDNIDMHGKIAQFIALATPFDGCGALALESVLLGYPLRLPIPRCSAKEMECNCVGTVTLGQHPNSNSRLVSKVFAKFIKERELNVQIDINEAEEERLASRSTKRSRFSTPLEGKNPIITLYPEVYAENECPDVLFLVAERILSRNISLTREHYMDLRNIEKACKSGAVTLKLGFSIPHIVQQSPCCIEKKERREGILSQFTNEKEEYEVIGYQTWDGDIFESRLYDDIPGIMEMRDSTGILSQFECAELATLEELEMQELVPLEYKTGSYYSLVHQCHEKSILDEELYRPNFKILRECEEKMLQPVTQSEIRFRSISGTGTDTAFHIIFERPVHSTAELLEEEPSFAMVPGDGTVCLLGALGDHYDGERVILEGMTHFGSVMDQRVFDLFKKWTIDDFLSENPDSLHPPIM